MGTYSRKNRRATPKKRARASKSAKVLPKKRKSTTPKRPRKVVRKPARKTVQKHPSKAAPKRSRGPTKAELAARKARAAATRKARAVAVRNAKAARAKKRAEATAARATERLASRVLPTSRLSKLAIRKRQKDLDAWRRAQRKAGYSEASIRARLGWITRRRESRAEQLRMEIERLLPLDPRFSRENWAIRNAHFSRQSKIFQAYAELADELGYEDQDAIDAWFSPEAA